MVRHQAYDHRQYQGKNDHAERYIAKGAVKAHYVHEFYSEIQSEKMKAVQPVSINTQLADQFEITHFKQGMFCIVLLEYDHSEKKGNNDPVKYYRYAIHKYLIPEQCKNQCEHIYHYYQRLAHINDERLEFVFV